MTHNDLVQAAARWLKKDHSIVVTEIASGAMEEPDAIGWRGPLTTLIECKASRSDFKADAKKAFRMNPAIGAGGMGFRRYYMAPRHMLRADEMPDKWGLLEFDGRRIFRAKEAGQYQQRNVGAEILVLLSVLRRIGACAPSGISIRCYVHQTNCRSSLSFAGEPWESP